MYAHYLLILIHEGYVNTVKQNMIFAPIIDKEGMPEFDRYVAWVDHNTMQMFLHTNKLYVNKFNQVCCPNPNGGSDYLLGGIR